MKKKNTRSSHLARTALANFDRSFALLAFRSLVLITGFALMVPAGYAATVDMGSKTHQVSANPSMTFLQVLASVGPLEYLSGATVTLKDAQGQVVAQGKTNVRGSTMFTLDEQQISQLPLSFITSGGKIIGATGDQIKGPAFRGHLRGQISDVAKGKHVMAYLDLLSTGASLLNTKGLSYPMAIQSIRAAFGIGKGFPDQGLRYRNNHVGWTELKGAIQKNGGHDQFIRQLVKRISRGESIRELAPSRHKTIRRNAGATQSAASYPQCDVPLGNSVGSGGASTDLIKAFGVLATQNLLQYVGYFQSTTFSGLPVFGMLLYNTLSSGPSADALAAVEAQLACISAQLNYLQEEVAALTLITEVATATTCAADITNQYYIYGGLVDGAQPNADGTPSPYPLTASNSSFMADLPAWSPSSTMVSACGGGQVINNMLFGTAGGQGSAWQQVNKNYLSNYGNNWWTQVQAQQLQQFLSYWSTLLYDIFVLRNEYFNYYGQTQNSIIAAGNVPESSTTCIAGTTNVTPTFCAWNSNIANAFPEDLYSDEIGIIGSGISVMAYPAGLGLGVGQLGLNTPFLLNNWTNVGNGNGQYYAAQAVQSAIDQYAGLGVNPKGYGTAVEDFTNPQSTHGYTLTESNISALNNTGAGGLSAIAFLFGELSSPSSSEFKSVSLSNVNFCASNSMYKAHVGSGMSGYYYTEAVHIDAALNSTDFDIYPCKNLKECHNVPTNPIMSVLLGRSWWPGATTATSYVPPNPQTP